jgi:hypothetical protein
MESRVAAWLVALGALLVGVTEGRAYAQTTNTESVTATAQVNPLRLVNGVVQNARPQNLNPTGINFADCNSNMVLQFTVNLNGFQTADNASLLIWAGKVGPCNSTQARGSGGATAPTCWPVIPNGGSAMTAIVGSATSVLTETYNINVRDIIGPMNTPTINYTPQPATVCTTVQQSFAAASLSVWFLPVDGSSVDLGTAYSYPISVDLVGPPSPVGLTESVGDTLFNINWTPNSDSDTAGYDIYIDPLPGGAADASATSTTDAAQLELICPDAATTFTATTSDDDAADGADSDVDATVSPSTSSGGGCYYVPVGNAPAAGASATCTTTVFSSGLEFDAGIITEVDEAGNTTTESGNGGISTVPSADLVGINAGFTVASPTASQYTITGLTNFVTYHVTVAAVDGSGNIGPPAGEVCDYPAPVNDFWTNYRNAGGLAGGGFCALGAVGMPVAPTVVFVAMGTGLVGVLRRRRRRR